MAPFEELKALVESGEFHHATYRNRGTVWEGLWFYRKDPAGLRGFSVVGCVSKSDPDTERAYDLLRGTGISVGSYGNG